MPWTQIPNVDCDDPAPAWPGKKKPTPAELHHWRRTWRRPQAPLWRELKQEGAIADYCQARAAAELLEGEKVLPILLRQEEQLGISIPGMLRNRWILVPVGSEVKGTRPNDPSRRGAKARLQAIEGGIA